LKWAGNRYTFGNKLELRVLTFYNLAHFYWEGGLPQHTHAYQHPQVHSTHRSHPSALYVLSCSARWDSCLVQPAASGHCRAAGAKAMSSADKVAALNARALFDAIDVDGGGTVDRDELRRGLQRLGKSAKEIALMIGAMRSAELTFDDFQELLTTTHGDLQANLHATLIRRAGMALVEVWCQPRLLVLMDSVRRTGCRRSESLTRAAGSDTACGRSFAHSCS
jgi:hypothetical protein